MKIYAILADTHDYDYGSQAVIGAFVSRIRAENTVDLLEKSNSMDRKKILDGADEFFNFDYFEVELDENE